MNNNTDELSDKENVFGHLMLDIETMGNESFSSIISIGALEFNINTGKTGKEFYTNVDLQSCLDYGLTVNASTIMWWMQQSEQARKDFVEKTPLRIEEALLDFCQFCNKEYQVWGNSARFDCGILQNAYNKLDIPIPWDFRKERCVRTLVSLNPEIKENFPSVGTAHNALSDCYYQVGYCSLIWQSLNKI
jgi:DNA polymerase III epsilon subunit-like protein